MPWIVHNGTLAHIEDRHIFAAVDDAIDHIINTQLSPCAYAILLTAPPHFRNGQVCSLRVLADFARYNVADIHRALQELVSFGFVGTQPYGTKGRHRYAGVPTLLWSTPVKARMQAKTRAA